MALKNCTKRFQGTLTYGPNALISQLIAIYQFDEEVQLKKKQVKTLMRFEARPLAPG